MAALADSSDDEEEGGTRVKPGEVGSSQRAGLSALARSILDAMDGTEPSKIGSQGNQSPEENTGGGSTNTSASRDNQKRANLATDEIDEIDEIDEMDETDGTAPRAKRGAPADAPAKKGANLDAVPAKVPANAPPASASSTAAASGNRCG